MLKDQICGPVYFELAWATPSEARNDRLLWNFERRLRAKIKERFNRSPIDLDISLIDDRMPHRAPAEQEVAGLLRRCLPDSMGVDLSSRGSSTIMLAECNLRFTVKVNSDPRYSRTSGPLLNQIHHPKDHPVYRAIERKADQAAKWRKVGGNFQPLIVVIGVGEGATHLNRNNCGSVTLRQAVFAAILNEKTNHPITRYNLAGSWPPYRGAKVPASAMSLVGPRVRVKSSALISGVVVTTLDYKLGVLGQGRGYVAKSELWVNEDAEQPLSEAQVQMVRSRLDFSAFRFQVGGLDWEVDAEPGETVQLARSRFRFGNLGYTLSRDMDNLTLKLPAIVLQRLLAGDVTWQDWLAPDSDSMRKRLSETLRSGREIVAIRLLEGAEADGEEPRVEITFGPVTKPVVRVKKDGREHGAVG